MYRIRAYKFRLDPDQKRQDAIDNALILSQQLYQEDKRFYGLYSHVRVDIRNRMLKAYQNFFRRCKEKKAGKKVKAVSKSRIEELRTYPVNAVHVNAWEANDL